MDSDSACEAHCLILWLCLKSGGEKSIGKIVIGKAPSQMEICMGMESKILIRLWLCMMDIVVEP